MEIGLFWKFWSQIIWITFPKSWKSDFSGNFGRNHLNDFPKIMKIGLFGKFWSQIIWLILPKSWKSDFLEILVANHLNNLPKIVEIGPFWKFWSQIIWIGETSTRSEAGISRARRSTFVDFFILFFIFFFILAIRVGGWIFSEDPPPVSYTSDFCRGHDKSNQIPQLAIKRNQFILIC